MSTDWKEVVAPSRNGQDRTMHELYVHDFAHVFHTLQHSDDRKVAEAAIQCVRHKNQVDPFSHDVGADS